MDSKPFILIVDDMPKNLQVVGNILDGAGYRFTLASSGKQALKVVERRLPDLILLDIMMPEMDGYEVCRALKSSPETADVPVIFLTAKTETEDIVKGFQCGGIDYITKPFISREMLARIKTHLEIVRVSSERKELLHILCHDLANPLSSIATIMSVGMAPEKFAAVREHLLNAATNGLQVIELVRNMSALEDNKIKLVLTAVDLGRVMDEAESLVKHKLTEKNIQLAAAVEPGLNVRAEKVSLLNSVLVNLLTNGIKFSYPGSKITFTANQAGDEVVIRVRDSGIGIPEKVLRNIFDLKKPTTRTGTNGEKGTGFGMPLVKKFVSTFGGQIEIFSKEEGAYPVGHGTEVKLTLKTGDFQATEN